MSSEVSQSPCCLFTTEVMPTPAHTRDLRTRERWQEMELRVLWAVGTGASADGRCPPNIQVAQVAGDLQRGVAS